LPALRAVGRDPMIRKLGEHSAYLIAGSETRDIVVAIGARQVGFFPYRNRRSAAQCPKDGDDRDRGQHGGHEHDGQSGGDQLPDQAAFGDRAGEHQRLVRRTTMTTPTIRVISTSNGSPT
jgi:hypothetical protein